eukprot:TRINITY_DN2800_c0_g2_i2.p2 TRINITY_DN2800_c0_g2~~TRINITY_DN2800_c0_g2_i2.p2  ORF type:complete len:168 (-),score=49.29 TRINITY_DN2800_c0_g2_i2:123-626(-)
MGSIVKITLLYDSAFWKEKGFSGVALSLSSPSSYIIDASGKDGKNPALLCFVNGKYAREYSLLGEEEKKHVVIKQLVSIFGEEARNYTDFIEQNWLKEVYSSGCYFNVPSVGVMSNFGYILRQNYENIHFAGSETAENWFGYIEGAIEAGYRVAEEIRKKILHSPKL